MADARSLLHRAETSIRICSRKPLERQTRRSVIESIDPHSRIRMRARAHIFSEGNMRLIDERFARLGIDNAPGQEIRQSIRFDETLLVGENLQGIPVDFSHGDVDSSAFEP